MEPRLKSSTQWSPFPADLCEQVAQVLTERFSEEYDIGKAQFVVEGRIFKEEVVGRFGLRTEGEIKQPNFELSFEYDSEKNDALEKIQTSMDVIEHLWTEFLEDDQDDSELLKTWQSLPYEKVMYFYRYSTVNSHLENEADKLLEEYEKKLVYQSPQHEEPQEETKTTLH